MFGIKLFSDGVNHGIQTINNLRKIPPGLYLVTDVPEIGKGVDFGYVTIKKNWLSVGRFSTYFRPSKDGTDRWEGDLEIKHRFMCEGSYRYLERAEAGIHRLYLTKQGIIKVSIFDDQGKYVNYNPVFWIRIER